MSNYSIKKRVDLDYEKALEKVKKELKKEGFGVLSELDLKKIFKEKIDKDVKKYTILGACNPKFAQQSIGIEKEVGLLLPCNVVVYIDDSNNTIVAAVDPIKSLGLSKKIKVNKISEKIFNRLKNVMEKM